MAGASLLITGGAGFLGYYFVHAIHHHNRNAAQSDWISLTVFDNYVRGVPAWTKELDGDCGVRFFTYDLASPLPDDVSDFEFVIHAASIASPNYYRQRPIETMDSNVNGLRALLDHFHRQQLDGKPVGGFLFMSSSEIYGDPGADMIPTPEDYRGLRLLHGSSRVLRRSETIWGNPVRQLCAIIRPPDTHAASRSTIMGPGSRSPTDVYCPISRVTSSPIMMYDAFRRHAHAHLLLCSRRHRGLLQSPGSRRVGEAYNSGWTARKSPWRTWHEKMVVDRAADLSNIAVRW